MRRVIVFDILAVRDRMGVLLLLGCKGIFLEEWIILTKQPVLIMFGCDTQHIVMADTQTTRDLVT